MKLKRAAGGGLKLKEARAQQVEDDKKFEEERKAEIATIEIEAPPLRDLGKVELKEPDDAIKAIVEVQDYARELKKRGDLHGEAMVKLSAGLKKAHERLLEADKFMREAQRIAPQRSSARADLGFLPAGARKQLYRTLATTNPSKLGYAAMFERSGITLPPHIAAFVKRGGADENTQARLLEWQAANDICVVTDMVLAANPESSYGSIPRPQRTKRLRVYRDFRQLSEEMREAAMDTATAGEGLEWVPTILSSQLKELINAELQLSQSFDWATMPGKVWDNPVEGADAIAYLVAEALDDPAAANAKPTASVPGTRKMTLTAVKLAARVVLSAESEEDLVIPAVPHVLARVARAIARGREKALVDGQKSGTIDTGDVPGATDVRAAWDGLRKAQKVVGASLEVDLSTLSAEGLANMRGVLKEYGQAPEDLVWTTGYSGMIRLLTLYDKATGGVPFVLFANQFGADNTMRRGVLMEMLGSPVVVSQFVREDLNASGIFDNVTLTKTILLLSNRRAFQGGERRSMTVRRNDTLKMETDQILVMGTWRGDFQKANFAGTQRFVALGKNIASY